MMPAWIGPTGISKTPSPSSTRCGNSSAGSTGTRRDPSKALRSGKTPCGHPSWTTSGRGSGCPTGMIPKRSCISRSCQFAAGTAVVSEGTSGRAASTEMRSVTNRSGAPGAVGSKTSRTFRSPSGVAVSSVATTVARAIEYGAMSTAAAVGRSPMRPRRTVRSDGRGPTSASTEPPAPARSASMRAGSANDNLRGALEEPVETRGNSEAKQDHDRCEQQHPEQRGPGLGLPARRRRRLAEDHRADMMEETGKDDNDHREEDRNRHPVTVADAGAQDHELAHEDRERRHAGERQRRQHEEGRAEGRHREEARDEMYVAGAVAGDGRAGGEEREGLGDTVVHHVQQRTVGADGAAEAETERDDPDVLNAVVAKEAFDVFLNQDERRRHDDRGEAEDKQHLRRERRAARGGGDRLEPDYCKERALNEDARE